MRRLVALVGLALASGSCLAGGDLAQAGKKTTHKLYVMKCAKCHELYDPKRYDDAKWTLWMERMRKKAKLKPEQYEALLDYTQGIRKGSSAESH